MNKSHPETPKQICEAILLRELRSNTEKSILASENVVIERLLARGTELAEAYEELHLALQDSPIALNTFLRLVLNTAAFWSPDKIRVAREERKRLSEINLQIAEHATVLATLLQERADLQNRSGFSCGTYHQVVDIIEAAAEHNHLFQSYLSEDLQRLRGQFDLRYWPTLTEILDELSLDAEGAVAEASDPLTAAATEGTRSSLADCFKALLVAIEENTVENCGHLPDGFRVTDNTLATLGNCALDLSVDELVDGPYIRRLRQRERNKHL